MQKYIFTIILGCLISILSIQRGHAEEVVVPDPVTNIQAQWVEGKILLTWKQVHFSGGIQGYNIYYSSEPIIANNGNYEDVQMVTSDTGSYIFEKAPITSSEIYFTMLAIGKNQEESQGFVIETKLLNNSLATKKNESMTVVGTSTNMPTTDIPTTPSSSLSSQSSLSSSGTTSSSLAINEVVSSSSVSVEIPYIRNPIIEANLIASDTLDEEQIRENIPLANSGMETMIIGSIALAMSGWYAMKKRPVH